MNRVVGHVEESRQRALAMAEPAPSSTYPGTATALPRWRSKWLEKHAADDVGDVRKKSILELGIRNTSQGPAVRKGKQREPRGEVFAGGHRGCLAPATGGRKR